MVAIDGLPAPCTCSMLLERLYPGAVPPDGTVTAKGFSDPHFQLIGQTEVNLTYDIRYLASTGYLWVVYTITSPTTSIPTTTPTPPANAFARLFAGAQNAFALLLPDKTTGVKVNDEFKNELIEMMRGMGAGVKTRQDLLDLIKFTHAQYTYICAIYAYRRIKVSQPASYVSQLAVSQSYFASFHR